MHENAHFRKFWGHLRGEPYLTAGQKERTCGHYFRKMGKPEAVRLNKIRQKVKSQPRRLSLKISTATVVGVATATEPYSGQRRFQVSTN
jgi:hypothetical protein